MPRDSVSTLNSRDAAGHSPVFSDVWYENERAMWWAELDSVGEEAVRSSIERNGYTPTGMEVARQWLARREFLELRKDVQSLRALAEQAQGPTPESVRDTSEAIALSSQVEANSRAIVEITATTKQNARTVVFVGTIASFLALCAIVMVFVSSKQAAPNTKQASAQSSGSTRAIPRALPAAVPSLETPQVSEEVAQYQPSKAAQIRAPDLKPQGPSLAEGGRALAIPPQSAHKEQPSNTPQVIPPEVKPKGATLADALALIADQLGGAGTIDFTAQVHDMATGRDHTEQLSYKASNVMIDPNRCQLGYQWHVEEDGRAVSDQDRTVELRLAKSIRVTSIDDEPGRRYSVRTYPMVYLVHIARWDNSSGDHLFFRDKDMAARVGTAARQAVELCDKGDQQFQGR